METSPMSPARIVALFVAAVFVGMLFYRFCAYGVNALGR